MRRILWPFVLVLLLILVLAAPAAAQTETAVSDLPPELEELIVRFYQAVSAEPGEDFDFATIQAITADPLRSEVLADLADAAVSDPPEMYYRYRNVRVVGGSCTGAGVNQVCEFEVRRVLETNRPGAAPPTPTGDLRVFRARQIGGEWKLFDTQVDGVWLSDREQPDPLRVDPAEALPDLPFELRPLVVPAAPEQIPGKPGPGAAPGQVPSQDLPAGWVTHENLDGGYAISLPPDWVTPGEDVFADPDLAEPLELLGIESPFVAAARDALAAVLIWRMQANALAQDLVQEIRSDFDPNDLGGVDVLWEENTIMLSSGPASEIVISVQPRDPAEPYGFVAVLYRLDQGSLTYQLAFVALTNRGDEGPIHYFRRMAQTFRLL